MKKKAIVLLVMALFFSPTILQAVDGSVICIHGFLRTYRCMRPMGKSLQKCGFDVCLWDYPSRNNTIRGHANNLLPILQAKAREKPGEPIHFVCHSLGSLILRTTLSMPECPCEAKIGRAILLAPPNKGSSLARSFKDNPPVRWFFGSKTGWELMNYTECNMICLGNYPDTMDVMVIAGTKGVNMWFSEPNDGILSVGETILNTPHCFCRIYEKHGSLMTSCDTITLVKRFLLNYSPKCNERNFSLEASEYKDFE